MKDLLLGFKMFRYSYRWKINLGVSIFYLLFSLFLTINAHEDITSAGTFWIALPCVVLIQGCYSLCGIPLIQVSPRQKGLLVKGTTGLLWISMILGYSIETLLWYSQFQKGRFDMDFIKMQVLLFFGMLLMIILYMPLFYRKPVFGYLLLAAFMLGYFHFQSGLPDSGIHFSGWLGAMNIRTVFVMGYVLILILGGLHYLISLMTWQLPFSQSIMNRFFRVTK